jgi:RNA polymerase sigma-70 factor (ECF subfamily)
MEPTATAPFPTTTVTESPLLDAGHFEQVVAHYWPKILRFTLAAVRDLQTAENLTQDCFWRAYRSRESFRGEASLHTWLMRIAVNLVRDHGRNRRLRFWKNAERSAVDSHEMQEWLADPAISPEDRASINEQVQAIWNATKVLSEKQRTIFLLRFVEEFDTSEIARATGLTENAVNVHLFRAVRAVRKRVRSE